MIVRRRKVDTKNRNFHFGGFLSSILGNIIIILTAIITGILAGLLFFYLSMYVQAKKVSTILPSYINMDSKKAEQELKKMGFKVVVLGESGKVIKMDPLPGRNVKLGREVKLFTENIKMVKIVLPDFKYSWYKTVERIMKELNISTSIKVVDSNEIYGTVLSTLPEPGKEIASSQNIILYISSGKTTTESSQKDNSISEEQLSTSETTSTADQPSGPVEVVPPSVDLNTIQKITPNDTKTKLDESQGKDTPTELPSFEENKPANPEQSIEGGQF